MSTIPAPARDTAPILARGPTTSGGSSLNADYLFETIVCDLHWSALHVGALSMLLRAWLRATPDWTLRPWRHVLLDDSGIMQLALRYCSEVGIAAEEGRMLTKLYADLAVAKASTAPITKAVKAYSPQERAWLAQSAKRWTPICLDSLRALQALAPEVRRRLPANYNEDGRRLIAFLSRAAEGDTREVSADGEIALPTLSQRRRSPRLEFHRSCRLVLVDSVVSAEIEDISRDGFGVRCTHALSVGQAVTIELDDGRRLASAVARLAGERVGLQLVTPLMDTDPLFRS